MDVSVIVNAYNCEQWIIRCLNSIRNQSLCDFECIIIDDCSQDNTYLICEKIREQDSRIQLYRNEENIGCSLTRKKGYDIAIGEYVLFVDCDDWLEPTLLEELVFEAKKKNSDLVFCDYYEEDGITQRNMVQNINSKTKNTIIKSIISYDPYLVSSLWNKLIRKDLLDKIEFPNIRYGEDMNISLQLFYFSQKYTYVSKALYHYWVNNSSSMCNEESMEFNRRICMYDICKMNVAFLQQHFSNIEQFDPQLSIRIIKTAIRVFEEKELRKLRNVATLYPPAFRYLFRQEINKSNIIKICLYFYLKLYQIKKRRRIWERLRY